MRGSFLSQGDDRVMIFDLEEPEIIERVLVENIPTEPENTEESKETKKPKYKSVITFPHNGVFGPYYDEDVNYLERVHYAGNWDVLRPAREVYEVNIVTDQRIDELLLEAEEILERWRMPA